MNQYLLDTNICIFFLRGLYDVPQHLEQIGRRNCHISEITVGELRKQGLMIDDFDILIGATALKYDMILVTENIKHLSRVPGIIIENWINR